MNLAESSARWLAEQDEGALRIAREIIGRREALKGQRTTGLSEYQRLGRAREEGACTGLRLALSYVSDRPGDISDTGAEGFIQTVESADEYIREYERQAPQVKP